MDTRKTSMAIAAFFCLMACKGGGCLLVGGDDCDDTCDYEPFRVYNFQVHSGDDECRRQCTGKHPQDREYCDSVDANPGATLSDMAAAGVTITWSSKDVEGRPIGGEIDGSGLYFLVSDHYDNGHRVQDQSWVDDLAEPPVFTVHVNGDAYEDVVFTIDQEVFDDYRFTLAECHGYRVIDLLRYPCIFVYSKGFDASGCREGWDPYANANEYYYNYMCNGLGIRVIKTTDAKKQAP